MTAADEGISGTNTKKRDEFNRMIDDCRDGRIDLIITKFISRFARNTLNCLNYVRELKEKGVTILFEKENIDTWNVVQQEIARREKYCRVHHTIAYAQRLRLSLLVARLFVENAITVIPGLLILTEMAGRLPSGVAVPPIKLVVPEFVPIDTY